MKKNSSKGASAERAAVTRRRRPTLNQRAEAIVNNPDRYDENTRNYVARALVPENGYRLGDIVREVEAGEKMPNPDWPLAGTPEPERETREWRAWKTQQLCAALQSGRFSAGEPGALAGHEIAAVFDRARRGRIIDVGRMQRLLPTLLEIVDEQEEIGRENDAARAEMRAESDEEAHDETRPDHVFAKLTYREARRIAKSLSRQGWDDDVTGDVLAIMFGLTYCPPHERESIMYEVLRVLMFDINPALKAGEAFVIERSRADRSEDLAVVD